VDGGSVRLADLDFAYNVESWKPRVRYRSGGTHGDLDIEQPDNSASLGDTEYRWAVKLNNKILTDLSVDMGAGEANLNIGEMRLRDVDVEIGAGELKMDLRGTPKSSYSVRIEGGAGSAEVRLPASVGIWATARGGIGNIDVQGLERREDHWVNPRALNSPVLVRIDVQGGVGEIKLIAE
jgi:hypothetical protein